MTSAGDRSRKRRGNIMVFSLLGLGVVIIIGIVGANSAFHRYDRTHMISVTCTVQSAEAGLGGSSSIRGTGSLRDQIEIQTSDCGELTLRGGVDAHNKARTARELDRGGRFTFRVGEASYRWRDVITRFRTPVVVDGYRATS
jgi:hypothetical protein